MYNEDRVRDFVSALGSCPTYTLISVYNLGRYVRCIGFGLEH
jgi:hypothetical protein